MGAATLSCKAVTEERFVFLGIHVVRIPSRKRGKSLHGEAVLEDQNSSVYTEKIKASVLLYTGLQRLPRRGAGPVESF